MASHTKTFERGHNFLSGVIDAFTAASDYVSHALAGQLCRDFRLLDSSLRAVSEVFAAVPMTPALSSSLARKMRTFFVLRILNTALVLTISLLISWLFSFSWNASWSASANIMNAVEAGTRDTVSHSTWLAIALGFFALVGLLHILTAVLTLRFVTVFRLWERFLVFSIPIAAASLTPLVIGPLPLASIAVITVCVSLRLQSSKPRIAEETD